MSDFVVVVVVILMYTHYNVEQNSTSKSVATNIKICPLSLHLAGYLFSSLLDLLRFSMQIGITIPPITDSTTVTVPKVMAIVCPVLSPSEVVLSSVIPLAVAVMPLAVAACREQMK